MKYQPDSFSRAFDALWRESLGELGQSVSVIVRQDDDLIAHWGGKIDHYPITGEDYHRLKRLAHLPACAMALRQLGGNLELPDSDEFVSAGAVADLESTDASAIFHQTREFWSETEKQCEPMAIRNFSISVHPHLQQVVRAAARLEVSRLFEVLKELEGLIPKAELNAGYFAVVAGNAPRYKELSKQLFTAHLRRNSLARGGWRHQLLYAEGAPSLEAVYELIAKRHVSQSLAEIFTGSSLGLEEDILGDAARIAIADVYASLKRPS